MASTRQPLGRALVRSQSSLYVCKSCRGQLLQPSITTIQQLRNASNKRNNDIPFTEKVRRKLWGTDNPPGLADPYGGPSFLEKRAMRRKATRLAQQEQEADDYPEQDSKRSPRLRQEPDMGSNLEETGTPGQAYTAEGMHEEFPDVALERDLPPMEEYKPADTTEGLEEVGHKGGWGDWRFTSEQPHDQYASWHGSTLEPASNRRELLSCLHQAVVECLACKQANIEPSKVLLFNPEEVDSNVYATTKVGVSPSGTLTEVDFASQAEAQQFLGQLATVGATIDEVIAQPAEVDNIGAQPGSDQIQQVDMDAIKATLDQPRPDLVGASEIEASSSPIKLGVSHYTVPDEAFLSSTINFQDLFAFVVLKRFSQLSGHRIPDPILNSAVSGGQPKTLSYLLDRIYDSVVKPQPKTVAEMLMSKQTLSGISNVMVLPRRETPVDKEKELGRWKVIERELKDRGLPVLGKLYD